MLNLKPSVGTEADNAAIGRQVKNNNKRWHRITKALEDEQMRREANGEMSITNYDYDLEDYIYTESFIRYLEEELDHTESFVRRSILDIEINKQYQRCYMLFDANWKRWNINEI